MDDYPVPPFVPPVRLPESSPNDIAGSYVPSRDDPIETLDDAAALLDRYKKQVLADLETDLSAVESDYRNQSTIAVGELDVDLDAIEREYARRYQKVGDSVVSALTESYYSAMESGYQIPSDDEILQSYETGDFSPPSTPVTPAAAAVKPPPAPPPAPPPPSSGPVVDGDRIWLCGTPGMGEFFYIDPLVTNPIWGGGTYEDYLMWVVSLGPGWRPFWITEDSLPPLVLPLPSRGATHPHGHWHAINEGGTYDCRETPNGGGMPVFMPKQPITFEPDPPPPPPPPPLDASCPVVDDCWEESAIKYFEKPYMLLSTDQQTDIRKYCRYLQLCKQVPGNPKAPPPFGVGKVKFGFKVKPPTWCDADIYEQLSDFSIAVTNPSDFLKGVFGIESDPNGGYKYPPWLEWMRGLKLIPDWVPQAITGLVDILIEMTHEASKVAQDALGERATTGIAADTIYNVFKLMNEWIGFPPGSWVRSWERAVNFFGPEEPPQTSEAIEGWLNGVYHDELRDAYIRGANNCEEPYVRLAHGRRTRPNVSDLVQLYLQKKISEEEWIKSMRENGVTEVEDMLRFRQLVDAYPAVPDLIRFLVRDVADEKVVKKYSLDADFEQKWQGTLVEYATAQGLNEKEARYYWRAHWDFPSPTQLYEMLHRLRPGEVPEDIQVTEEDVAEALGINDVNPYWRRRMMATSYNPLTRTDTQRAFFIGAMDDAEVLASYQDGGYTLENAKILLRFTKKLRDNQRRSAAGLPGPKQIISAYVDGLSGVRETADALREFGWDEDLINKSLTNADLKRERSLRAKRIARVKREYIRGDIDTIGAQRALALLGLDNNTIKFNLDGWDTEQAGRSKLPTAAQLCKWYGMGLMSADEYQDKLYAIGYRGADLARVLGQCGLEVNEKNAKKQEQAADKAKREREKQEREQERKRKEAERKEEKRKKEEEKRRKEEEKRRKEEERNNPPGGNPDGDG